jgi:hypothetical protein
MQTYLSVPCFLKRVVLVCRGAIWAASLSTALLAGGTHARATNAGPAKGTLAFNPASANFASVNVGDAKTISLTITNTGTATVAFNRESLYANAFGATSLALPYSLAPGKHLTVKIYFAPRSSGQFGGYIAFGSDATNGAVNYEMTGTGVGSAGAITAMPSTVSFGSVPVGTSNSQAVQLKNTGTTNITISAWAASKPEFLLKGLTTPSVLAPGKTASCTLVYTPRATGYAAASTSITSTASNKTLTLVISGTGVVATRVLTETPTILNFGNESLGNTHTLPVSLKNSGNSSVVISGISVLATDIATGGGVNGAIIAPGQTATLSVSFTPKKVEAVSGSIKIASSAMESTTTIDVSGAGVSSAGHSVALSWQASISPNVTGYYLYRASGLAGTYSKLVTAPVSGLKYTDASVVSGEAYKYAVTAADSSGRESSYSPPVTAVIP